MTDKEEQTPDNNIENPESSTDVNSERAYNDDLDIEGALAAVASLQDLSSEVEPEVDVSEEDVLDEEDESLEIQEFERIESDESDLAQSEDDSDQVIESVINYENSVFPRPSMSVLHRGQLASVVPAVLLIGIGVYLTFLVTTSSVILQPGVIVAILVGAIGAMLLAQWLSSARWAIGSFFIGILLLLTGGTLAYLILPNNLSLMNGYPLLLTAIGTAFVITDIFVPSGRRAWLIGLILAIAGLIGVATTTMLMGLAITDSARGLLLAVAIVIIIVFLIAPILRRRQQ